MPSCPQSAGWYMLWQCAPACSSQRGSVGCDHPSCSKHEQPCVVLTPPLLHAVCVSFSALAEPLIVVALAQCVASLFSWSPSVGGGFVGLSPFLTRRREELGGLVICDWGRCQIQLRLPCRAVSSAAAADMLNSGRKVSTALWSVDCACPRTINARTHAAHRTNDKGNQQLHRCGARRV